MKKQILLIGAGAVGLVYGKHFSDAGHDVTFFVREKYLDELSKGVTLYHLNRSRSLNDPIHFKSYDLISSFDELKNKNWDQVYLCFSSTALQSFDFAGFKDRLTGKPTIVMLQPSIEDYEVLVKTFPADQIVEGMITLISYSAPLATETTDQPGTAYWIPPMMPTPFSGPKERRNDVIKIFRQGSMSANSTKSVQLKSLFPASFLATFLTALEASGWKFEQLKKDQALLVQFRSAMDEVFTGLEIKHGTKRPFPFRFAASPVIVKILLSLAPKVMPMDIETYFEYHFTKVKSQTKFYMNNYLAAAKEAGTSYATLAPFNALTG